MQVRPGGKAGITGIGDVFPESDVLADAYADRIPVQVSIDRDRAVVVQNFDDIGLSSSAGSAPEEGVVTDVDDDASRAAYTGVPSGKAISTA